MGQVEGLRVALDLTEQWNALGGDSQLITAVLLVRSEFLDQHPQAVARFMEEYAASAAFVNDQPAEAAVLVEKYGIVKAAVPKRPSPPATSSASPGRHENRRLRLSAGAV